jgi:hypothetical protein
MSVTLTLIEKQASTSIAAGTPMGLLLALTYADPVVGGLVVTLQSKN